MRHRCPGKIESYAKFLEEEKFLLQRAISKFVSEHVIPLDLVFNLEQTHSLMFHSVSRYLIWKFQSQSPSKVSMINEK